MEDQPKKRRLLGALKGFEEIFTGGNEYQLIKPTSSFITINAGDAGDAGDVQRFKEMYKSRLQS
jgi:hypothetical protein